MKKSQIGVTIDNYVNCMNDYIVILNKLADDQTVFSSKGEKIDIIEAFVFKLCAEWEVFVETLLVDCLNKDTSKYSEFMGLKIPKHVTRDQCIAMVSGLGYFDTKGINDLKNVVKNILTSSNNGFKEIKKADGLLIDDLFTIRNYLSHFSYKSERGLKKMYKNRYQLRTFRTPGEFLYAIDKKNKQMRIGNYSDALFRAANSIAKFHGLGDIFPD